MRFALPLVAPHALEHKEEYRHKQRSTEDDGIGDPSDERLHKRGCSPDASRKRVSHGLTRIWATDIPVFVDERRHWQSAEQQRHYMQTVPRDVPAAREEIGAYIELGCIACLSCARRCR